MPLFTRPTCAGSKICTYDAYANSDWLNGFGYNLIARGGVTQCGELLKKKQVDGIYMDLPILQYVIPSHFAFDWNTVSKLEGPPPSARTRLWGSARGVGS